MIKIRSYKGIWFYGLSGSGKTLLSNCLKKKIKNFIILDGDQIRKYISTDLGYSKRAMEEFPSRYPGTPCTQGGGQPSSTFFRTI